MKCIAFALIASAASLISSTGRADTRVSIGVNVGAPAYRPAPPTVVYAPPPPVVYAPAPSVVVAPSFGYWKEVPVKTWVPDRWVVRTNRWGRSERHLEAGYFTYTTTRVWVDGRSDRDRRDDGYGRRDDRYGYGYNDNRGSGKNR